MFVAVATSGPTPREQTPPEAARTVVRWLDPLFGLAFGPFLLVAHAPGLAFEPWFPWGVFCGASLLGFGCGWRVVVGPRGVSVARTLLGVPLRFYRLGSSVDFALWTGFDEGSDGIEVRSSGRCFQMASLRREVLGDAFDRILAGIERAGLETAPLGASVSERRVFQPRSAPVTF